MGISAHQIQLLRIKFGRNHGERRDEKLAGFLIELREECGDHPRLLRSRLPSGRYDQRELGPAEVKEAAEESGYTTSHYQALPNEPEAVPADFQTALSKRAGEQFKVARLDETERRELRDLGSRAKDLAKRAPQGTNLRPAIDAMRAHLDALDRAIAKAA